MATKLRCRLTKVERDALYEIMRYASYLRRDDIRLAIEDAASRALRKES